MRIGIDFDGVITDWAKFCKKYGEPFYNKKCDTTKYEDKEMFGVEDTKAFWDTHEKLYASDISLRKDAIESINKLLKDGHEIYIITNRFDKFTNYTYKLFYFYGIKDVNIIFNKPINSLKDKICKLLEIDLMIEDEVRQLKALNNVGIKTLCMNCDYNKEYKNNLCTRVNGWKDVLSVIEEIDKKKDNEEYKTIKENVSEYSNIYSLLNECVDDILEKSNI